MEKKSYKLIISRADFCGFSPDCCLLVLYEKGKAVEIALDRKKEGLLHSIHLAKVKHIVKNIDAAFLEIAGNKERDLVYYSLQENRRHIFLNAKRDSVLHEGDEIMVQITKESSKTKQAVASSHIHLTGSYVVLSRGGDKVKFSSKIKDKEFKEKFTKAYSAFVEAERESCGGLVVTLRTNAYGKTDFGEIFAEIKALAAQLFSLLQKASYMQAPAQLREGDSLIKRYIQSYYKDLEEVLAEDEELLQRLSEDSQIRQLQHREGLLLRHYRDREVALYKLYSLESLLEQVLSKKVWLSSGAYLVIEYTEALTVIDVNTGKNVSKKENAETVLATNVEAALESARQIRLRNLSGIILIDFINMRGEEQRQRIREALNGVFAKDRQKTRALDFTSLDLAQITRQRSDKPLWEVFKNKGEK